MRSKMFLVSFIVENIKFRSIQEAASVQAIHGNVIAPLIIAVADVEAAADASKRTVRRSDFAMRLPLPSPICVVTTITRLVLPPNSAGGAPEMTSSD